jgi:hypothetical protein
MKTLRELAEDLATYDEVDVLELLDLTSEMVINRFMDRVEEREAYLRKELYGSDDGSLLEGRDSDNAGFGSHFDGYDYDEWN